MTDILGPLLEMFRPRLRTGLAVDVPRYVYSPGGILPDIVICPEGGCQVQVGAEDVQLIEDSEGYLARAKVIIRSIEPIPVEAGALGSFGLDVNTGRGARNYISVEARVRMGLGGPGFWKVDTSRLPIPLAIYVGPITVPETVEDSDVEVTGSGLLPAVLATLRGQALNALRESLPTTLNAKACEYAGEAGTCPVQETPEQPSSDSSWKKYLAGGILFAAALYFMRSDKA